MQGISINQNAGQPGDLEQKIQALARQPGMVFVVCR